MTRLSVCAIALAWSAAFCCPALAQTVGDKETGLAAIFADDLQGRLTASGTPYDSKQLTGAHKTLPFGTQVNVVNAKNNRTVTLVINDRGPAQPERVLGISSAAAQQLGFSAPSMREVTLEVVTLGDGRRERRHDPVQYTGDGCHLVLLGSPSRFGEAECGAK